MELRNVGILQQHYTAS